MERSENKIGDVPLVGVSRAGLQENVHRGRICVVSADDGRIVESYGDVEAPTYVRSTGKPLQAIASLLGGIERTYGWEGRHLAMMAASQRGYPEQMAALAEMLSTSGVPEEALVFHAAKPIASEPHESWARDGGVPRKLYHTCAGKHLGMLAWSRMEGWPLDGYAEPDHPSQQEILRRVLEWTGTKEAECRIGSDGCGLPVAAIPMSRIALGYARLACLDAAPDQQAAEAAAKIT
jgi:L-asparaginase II